MCSVYAPSSIGNYDIGIYATATHLLRVKIES